MHKKQATGLDTRMMLPVYAGILCIIFQWALPWISIPALKYSKRPTTYRLLQMDQCVESIQLAAQTGGKLNIPPLSLEEMGMLCSVLNALKWVSLSITGLLAVCCVVVIVKKSKSQKLVSAAFALQLMLVICQIVLLAWGNAVLNHRMNRPNTFVNLSLHSYLQLTSWVYAQFLLSAVMLMLSKRLLCIQEGGSMLYQQRAIQSNRNVGRRTKAAVVLLLIAIPVVIFFGIFFLNDRSSVFIGVCIICLAMLPFAMVFEGRRPQAAELLVIAVMAGIAVAGRMAFFMLPQFKPVCAVVIIAGVGLGAEAGLLTGAVSGFVSNFFFGQGPWTPWQMFAYGIIGFIAGLLFHRAVWFVHAKECIRKFVQCLYGGVAAMGIYGFLMDASSVLNFSAGFSWEMLLAKLVSGLPFNLIHGVSTMIFLWVLAEPMEKKLERIKKKYGILEV